MQRLFAFHTALESDPKQSLVVSVATIRSAVNQGQYSFSSNVIHDEVLSGRMVLGMLAKAGLWQQMFAAADLRSI